MSVTISMVRVRLILGTLLMAFVCMNTSGAESAKEAEVAASAADTTSNHGGRFYVGRTFGRYEDATGASVTINSGEGDAKANTQVMGTDARGMTKYTDRDHVGLYVSASSFAPIVTSDRTRYGAASISAPEISSKSVVPGMVIETEHKPHYVAIATGVSGNSATVNGWFQVGSGASGTPPDGVGATINPNTKIWGANINLLLPPDGQAIQGTGIELGLFPQKKGSGANTWGYDAVTLRGEKPLAHFISRGPRVASFMATNSGGDFGFLADGQDVAFETRDSKAYAYTSVVKGARKWSVDATGSVSRQFEAIRSVTGAALVGDDDVFLLVASGSTINLPSATGMRGRSLTFRPFGPFALVAAAGQGVDGEQRRTFPSQGTVNLICDGRGWISF